MSFSKRERVIFRAILVSFILGTCFILFASAYVPQRLVERAWIGPLNEILTEDLIGVPSRIVQEVQAVLFDEDVALPTADGYNTGFITAEDGFGFRNYGSRYPEGDLTINEVQALFGDQVCAAGTGEECLPIPTAQVWIDLMNDYMTQGHCAGFTIASHRFVRDQLDQGDFAISPLFTFDIEQNPGMMRQIAKDWVLQVTEEVADSKITLIELVAHETMTGNR
ncbi:MAG: hypothetical protein AAF485_19350, partial [Chloroflexota bacterium]